MYEVSPHFLIRDGVMIQNQVGAGLAPFGNFCDIARCEMVSAKGSDLFRHQAVLLKMPKDATPAPDGFSNLRVSATQNH